MLPCVEGYALSAGPCFHAWKAMHYLLGRASMHGRLCTICWAKCFHAWKAIHYLLGRASMHGTLYTICWAKCFHAWKAIHYLLGQVLPCMEGYTLSAGPSASMHGRLYTNCWAKCFHAWKAIHYLLGKVLHTKIWFKLISLLKYICTYLFFSVL